MKEGDSHLSFSISNYEFQGLFNNIKHIENSAGVFAVICKKNNEYIIIYIGQADDIKTEIENREHKNLWKEFLQH